ncbi:MAG: hypothetical protein GF311_23725 [Candidatus Lokiarchaeota archaeon]|nr:hypothetical protein [Candidatus Lokiarchaeota archaeon]
MIIEVNVVKTKNFVNVYITTDFYPHMKFICTEKNLEVSKLHIEQLFELCEENYSYFKPSECLLVIKQGSNYKHFIDAVGVFYEIMKEYILSHHFDSQDFIVNISNPSVLLTMLMLFIDLQFTIKKLFIGGK